MTVSPVTSVEVSKPQRHRVVTRTRIASAGGHTYRLTLDCGHITFRARSQWGDLSKTVDCHTCPRVPA